jgi:hypothetical protein
MGNTDTVMHQSNPVLNTTAPKETNNDCYGVEMEKPEDVVCLVEDATSANRSN